MKNLICVSLYDNLSIKVYCRFFPGIGLIICYKYCL